MLTKIEGLPAYVLGIRASGEVTQTEMEQVLLPGLDELAASYGELNYLLVLDTDIQNFTAAAWWKDMVAGLKHFTEWRRIAVVTDQEPVKVFTDLFELDVPGKSKGFRHDQLNEAIAWVGVMKGDVNLHKPISPKGHAIIDYALVACLIAGPALLKLNKKARLIYAAEAAVLLPYIALTKQPVAVRGLIPFKTHGKIDPFNIAQFALQTFFRPFRKTKKELLFNVAFTAVAGLTVMLTDWRASK